MKTTLGLGLVLAVSVGITAGGCLGEPFSTGTGAGGSGGAATSSSSSASSSGVTSSSSSSSGSVSSSASSSSTGSSGNPCGSITQKFCNGQCLEVSADADNCGDCGNRCAMGEACVSGSCVCGGVACSSQNVCEGMIATAEACLTCGTKCGQAQTCNLNGCVCRPGLTNCNGGCVDTSFDHENCGGCGKPCAGGMFCVNGFCRTETECTTSGAEACGNGTCLPASRKQVDPLNCGSCDATCKAGEDCVGGKCVRYFALADCENNTLCGTRHACCALPAGTSGKVCYEGSVTCPGG